MSVFDALFNLGARGPGLPLAGIMRPDPPTNQRFGSIQNVGNAKRPRIGTKPVGKISIGWRKV